MGRNAADQPTPDLFSTASGHEPSAASSKPDPSKSAPNHSLPRHILPVDLPSAIKQLSDTEFERLLSVVIAEQKRRGKKLIVAHDGSGKQKGEATPALTRGQVNAVRAAFKAGITPSRIARQFGISQSNVRKALASNSGL
jgi:hypothetical protein